MTRVDVGYGLIEMTGFDGPVIVKKIKTKNPGSFPTKRKKSCDRNWVNPTYKQPEAQRHWYKIQYGGLMKFRNKPGFWNSNRTGIPDGMRKADAERLWADARVQAVNMLKAMIAKGMI